MKGKTKKKSGASSSKGEKKEVVIMKNAQSWSIDLIIAVIIFMLVIAIFYAILNSRSEPTIETLEDDSRIALATLSEQLIVNGVINEDKFEEFCLKSYEQVKSDLKIENDFCFYLEDKDGNIISCNNGKVGIGNEQDITISTGIACGATS